MTKIRSSRRIALTKALDFRNAACEMLSTIAERPVTLELIRNEPSISSQLEVMTETLLKEIPVMTEKLDAATGKRKTILETIFPYGIGKSLTSSWPQLLKMTDQPDARRVVSLYDSLSPNRARSLPIEAFCYAAGVSSLRILGILTGVIVEQGARASSILTAVWNPRVVEKTVQMALTDEGVTDRMMIHKATGFLPMSKGATTTINVQQNQQHSPTVQFVPAPPPESTIRALADTFNEARGLPPTVTVPVIDLNIEDAPDEDEE